MLYKIEPKYSLLMFLIAFVFGRGIKYTLYDSAKEIATIPIQHEIKRIGKILDMLGVGLGRFLGHLLPVILFTIFPYADYENISDIVVILYLTVGILFYVVNNRLGKEIIAYS